MSSLNLSRTHQSSAFAQKPHRRSSALSLTAFFDLWRQRRHLAKLDDAALRDIGLSSREACVEARRPFWDAPDYWRP